MKMLRAAEPPLPSHWGWAEIFTLAELIYFNPLQTDHLREVKEYKKSGQLLCKTHHTCLTFQEIGEPLFYFGRELASFLIRIVFKRQQHFPSKHIPLQANWLWACQLLARFNLGLDVANGNMNHFQHWNRCNIWSRSSWRRVGRKSSVWWAWRWSPLLESHSLVFHQGGDQKQGKLSLV